MYAQFDTVDPESDQHWIDKTQQAWKMFDKVCSQLKDRTWGSIQSRKDFKNSLQRLEEVLQISHWSERWRASESAWVSVDDRQDDSHQQGDQDDVV